MQEYLIDLKNALEAVNSRYYSINALNRNGNAMIQQPEDNFSTELIRYLRNIQESPERRNSYNGLNFDFSILKNRFGIQPDIVLHEGANNQNRQELFIEVKSNSDSVFMDDLNKIMRAISNELHFRNAIMVVINKNLNSTLKSIRKFVHSSHLRDVDLQKLFLFHARCVTVQQIQYSYYSFNNLDNPINE